MPLFDDITNISLNISKLGAYSLDKSLCTIALTTAYLTVAKSYILSSFLSGYSIFVNTLFSISILFKIFFVVLTMKQLPKYSFSINSKAFVPAYLPNLIDTVLLSAKK